jgi:NADH-quinone oxidoreductase subunit J
LIGLIAFYVFATMTIASAVAVIFARNPVHSVLWLIVAFFNAAGLMLIVGAEFIAMLLVIVYVGAVAVLFLFVVMMLDVDFAELRSGFLQYLPIGALIGVIFLIELILVVGTWAIDPNLIRVPAAAIPPAGEVTNTAALGRVLYTHYFFAFQAAGLILLVAMIGAIVLTLRERLGVKRQDIAKQVARTQETAIEVRKVPFREGLKDVA